MKKNFDYVAPEAKLRATRVRCSILAGSGQGQTEVRPNQPADQNTSGENFTGDPDDANPARARLTF
ncbi:MAG: hypothetical protein J5663_02405 [Bacteroidaceae bacterium]|nr:hypothetical protein [Bacteroidaceae bacterium]